MNKRKKAFALTLAGMMMSSALTGCGRVEINKVAVETTTATSAEMASVQTFAVTALTTGAETTVEETGTEETTTTKTTKKTSKDKKKSKKKKTTTTTEVMTRIPAATTTTTAATTTAATTTTTVTTTTTPATTTATTTQLTEGPLPDTKIPEFTAPPETTAALPEIDDTQETQQAEFDGSEQQYASRSHKIDLNCILQNPELPMGCEAVSLTMVFNYYGIYADKMTVTNYYMPRDNVYWENGTMHGPDYRYVFAGDPADARSYGCLAPCMMTTAQNYLNDVGGGMRPFDASGTEFDDLLSTYIDKDVPLLLWVTTGLATPYYSHTWITPSGEQMSWLTPEHCLVLTGYDYDNGIVYVADPMVGNTYYSYDLVKQRYNELGRQSMGLTY